ncbi:MAG: hypothetical protein K5872_18780 [Rhizobiaceae bacterium]|nr:hypothetical protein [Rhizobiaceae bacterium]MCV0408273.1 hypothetical protein [Rhizobiaceae bacterium]
MGRLGLVLCALPLAGCVSDDYSRAEGLSYGAGEAIAANSVMQMVDPWPAGVEDTRVETPADLGRYRRGQAERSGATSQTDSSVTGDN